LTIEPVASFMILRYINSSRRNLLGKVVKLATGSIISTALSMFNN